MSDQCRESNKLIYDWYQPWPDLTEFESQRLARTTYNPRTRQASYEYLLAPKAQFPKFADFEMAYVPTFLQNTDT